MEEMTGKAITSSGLPFCLGAKETDTKFHHRLKCYLNILENVVLLSEIWPAFAAATCNLLTCEGGEGRLSSRLSNSGPASPIMLVCDHRLKHK